MTYLRQKPVFEIDRRRQFFYRIKRISWLATCWMRPLPSFVIFGVQKGGTTSLYNYIVQHPQVRGAVKKALHFFHNPEVFNKGVFWYRSYFPRLTKDRKHAGFPITGEASPNYMFHPDAPSKMASVIPDVKLIAVLRNPVDRAFSHYKHEMRIQLEDAPTFEQALEDERERLKGDPLTMLTDDEYYHLRNQHYYLARGHYYEQLKLWHQHFDPSQFLILSSEEMFERPEEVFQQVLDFLGLPSFTPEEFERFNPGEYSEQVNPETRAKLNEYFRPHNERLYELIGKDFGWEKAGAPASAPIQT